MIDHSMKTQMDLFYTPQYAKAGDVIPFYNDETKQFENYYLKNWNPDAPAEKVVHGWHRIVTKDNRTYEESPVNICGGTGSVIRAGDWYHLFYCTFDQEPQAQWARHAVSRDLKTWEDIPEDKFGPDGVIYRMSDWRIRLSSGIKKSRNGGCCWQQGKTHRQSATDV